MEKRILFISLILIATARANVLAFWGGTSGNIPTDWKYFSQDFEDGTDFFGRYPMCNASSYGFNGGPTPSSVGNDATHTHVLNKTASSVSTGNSGFTQGLPNGANVGGNLHTMNTWTTNNARANGSEPTYVKFIVILYTKGIPVTIPQGAIIFFNSTTIPAGWDRLEEYDTRFPRAVASTANVTGGRNNHTHRNLTGTLSSPSTAGIALGTGKSVSTNSHTHLVTEINLTETDNIPPYFDMIMIQAVGADRLIPNGSILMFNTTISNANFTQVTECDGKLIRANDNYGETGGMPSHTHPNVTAESGNNIGGIQRQKGATNFAVTHSHASVNFSINNASNFPPYKTVLMYRFQLNVTDIEPPNIFIHAPANNTLYCSSTISLNHTETDNSGLSACWYNLNDGSNTTITCNQNTTIGSLSTGNYTLNLYANDTLNNLNKSAVSFSIDVTLPTTIINSPLNQTYNQTNTTVLLNLTSSSDASPVIWNLNNTGNNSYSGPQDILAGNGSNLLEVFTYDACNFSTYNNRYFTINLTANFTPTPTPQPGNNTKLFREPWFRAILTDECRYPFPLDLLFCRRFD